MLEMGGPPKSRASPCTAEGRAYRGQTPAPLPRGSKMSPLSCARNPALGLRAVGKPASLAGWGRNVIFWRLPCPHVAFPMGIIEDAEAIDLYELLQSFDVEEGYDVDEFIEHLDNQQW